MGLKRIRTISETASMLLIMGIVLAGCAHSPSTFVSSGSSDTALKSGESSAPASATANAVNPTSARTLLDSLKVRPETREHYQRSDFMGSRDWNLDTNGCKTRTLVLRDTSLVPTTHYSNCAVKTGKWHSVFDDATFTDPSKVTIDHMVPLLEAWDSGASSWSYERRNAYGNDRGYIWDLIVMSEALNKDKGHKDQSEWTPVHNRCTYAAAWVAVKWRWSLSVDRTEYNAINKILGGCGPTSVHNVSTPTRA